MYLSVTAVQQWRALLKVARKYGKIKGGENKNIILHMNNSFHGRT